MVKQFFFDEAEVIVHRWGLCMVTEVHLFAETKHQTLAT
jgi:hypothetical protein